MTVREAIYKEMQWSSIQELDDNVNLTEYGVDSLKAITILYQLEEKLGVEITNEVIESCQTVDDIISNVTILLKNKPHED
jgi:acyl carrier protein